MIFLIRQLTGQTSCLEVEFTDTETHLDTLKNAISHLLGFDPVTQTIYSSKGQLTHEMDLSLLTGHCLEITISSPVSISFPNLFNYYLLYTTPYLRSAPLCSIFPDGSSQPLVCLGIDHGCAKIKLTSIPEDYGLEWALQHHGFISPDVCPEGINCPLREQRYHSVAFSHSPVISRKTEGHQYGWLVLNSKIRQTVTPISHLDN